MMTLGDNAWISIDQTVDRVIVQMRDGSQDRHSCLFVAPEAFLTWLETARMVTEHLIRAKERRNAQG